MGQPVEDRQDDALWNMRSGPSTNGMAPRSKPLAADTWRAQPMNRLASTPMRQGHGPSSVSSESARIAWAGQPARGLGGSRRNDASAQPFGGPLRALQRALMCIPRANSCDIRPEQAVCRTLPRSATPHAACAARMHRPASSWAQTSAQRCQGEPSRFRRELQNRAAPSRHKGGATGTAHALRENTQPGVHKDWRTMRRERDRECEGGDLNPHGVTR